MQLELTLQLSTPLNRSHPTPASAARPKTLSEEEAKVPDPFYAFLLRLFCTWALGKTSRASASPRPSMANWVKLNNYAATL